MSSSPTVKENRSIDQHVSKSVGLIANVRMLGNQQVALWRVLFLLLFITGFAASMMWVISANLSQFSFGKTTTTESLVTESPTNEMAQGLLNLTPGWNFIGIPVQPSPAQMQEIFELATNNTIYAFDAVLGEYVATQSLEPATGYWLHTANAAKVVLTGQAISKSEIILQAGWNLISGITCAVPVGLVTDTDRIIDSVLGIRSGQYYAASIIRPATAYWVRADSPGNVTIQCAYDTTVPALKADQTIVRDGSIPGLLPPKTDIDTRLDAVPPTPITTAQPIERVDFSDGNTGTIKTHKGWNLISIPFTNQSQAYTDIFTHARIGTLYYYDTLQNSYATLTIPEFGKGYWMYVDTPGTDILTGTMLTEHSFQIERGWNMIGSIACTVPVDTIEDPQQIFDQAVVWGLNETGYYTTTTLQPGHGYLLYTAVAGEITVRCPGFE